jgi:hypothetical protein
MGRHGKRGPGIGKLRRDYLAGTMALVLFAASILTGCAFRPEMYQETMVKKPFKSKPAEPPVVRGKNNFVLDHLGHYLFSLPAKFVLWNWSVGKHRISGENEEILRKYMEVNGLTTTQVRLNTYAPHKEFARLKKNKDVHAVYKYLFGTFTVLFYTLIPDRIFAGLFGGDHYNPFTNTVHIYSDHSAILVHEGGHAKDWAERKRRGTYAFLRGIPYVDLYQEEIASSDAVSYFYCRKDNSNLLNAYPILIPAHATYISKYVPYGGGILVIIGSHIYGRHRRGQEKDKLAPEPVAEYRGPCWVEGEPPVGGTP